MVATTETRPTTDDADSVVPKEPIVLGLTDTAYHADTSTLSSTGAKRLLDCPARFRWEQDHPRPYTPAFELGHAAHTLTLGTGTGLHVVQADSWRTKAARTERDDALTAGLTPLLEVEFEQVQAMHDTLTSHPIAGPLFERADRVCEASLYWTDPATEVACRARPDWWSQDRTLVVDLKTTSKSADPADFGRLAAQYGYHLQAAWYLEAVRAVTGVEASFVHVVQETTPPYLVSVVQLNAEALQVGAEQADRARRLYANCQATGQWPGYTPAVHPAHLPGWYLAQHDALAEQWAAEVETENLKEGTS
ncbi:PD-(D/E)XK nuclease-like domain-containing protein [Actinomyces gaoshouyii]|uniref:PD-(D/E)XK nuclease-like domain-containing protein n=1 Tax=Actinomyces gaoshouyii TaxID=1960083 RepID=UPI0009C1A18B|nr:PD-(D/E)XK nuclease-like domain-containing protein [Actinomyces gaoshouyii]ARD42500.1 hypothetical protein B6G06_09230 [Actinomyces gaoshouyii]